MKKITLFFILTITSVMGFAQGLSKNAQKYYFYRNRLNMYFVSVGNQHGQSLLAQGRNGRVYDLHTTCLPYGNTYSPTMTSQHMDFDDEPNHLGWYIGMLATEWKLKNDEGVDVSDITRELFYAIEAINRLDQYDAGIGNTALDGFIVRDDVPRDFIQQHPELNPIDGTGLTDNTKNSSHTINSSLVENGKVNIVDSVKVIQSCPDQLGLDRQAASRDHYTRLLLGLSLVKKCIPITVTYNGHVFADGRTNFKTEAEKIADRILTYMQNNDWILFMPTQQPALSSITATVQSFETCMDNSLSSQLSIINSAFSITNCPSSPGWSLAHAKCTTKNISSLITLSAFSGLTLPQFDFEATCNPALTAASGVVPRGAYPIEQCAGYAQAGLWLTGDVKYSYPYDFTAKHLRNAWLAQSLPWPYYTYAHPGPGALSFTLTLAAIGNSWYYYNWGTTTYFNHTQELMYGLDHTIHANAPVDAGMTGLPAWNVYTLLQAFLHNETNTTVISTIRSEVETVLDDAPCEGSHLAAYCFASGGNCFTDYSFYHNPPNPNADPITATNGIEYLLLYNLYQLVYRSTLPNYTTNWLDFDIASQRNIISGYDINMNSVQSFPWTWSSGFTLPWNDIGSTSHPVEVRAYRDLTYTGTVAANGSANLYATGNVNVPAGFQAAVGGYAFPNGGRKFYCSGGTNNYNRSAGETTIPISFAPNKKPTYTYTKEDSTDESPDPFYLQENEENGGGTTKNTIRSSQYKTEVKVTPNPNNGTFILELFSPVSESATVSIYNTLGVKVQTISEFTQLQQGVNRQQINTEHLAPGFYNIQLKTPTQVINKQFIIQ